MLAAQDAQKPDLAAITAAWLASPHGDKSSPAFTHWDKDGQIPGECAVCHSATGMADYLATDRSKVGMIDHPVPTGTAVECATCHGDLAKDLTSAVFPSGATLDMGHSAICATCHQGRESADSVNAALAGRDDDAVSGDLTFINVHYKAAAATQMGDLARGGYQYEGKTYAGKMKHPAPLDSCIGCHDPHTTAPLALAACTTCHKGAAEFTAIRTTPGDLDGDGDAAEGIAFEISTLQERLGQAMQLYAAEVAKAPIVHSADAYPYFFNDTDGDGKLGEGEAAFPNRYQSWTPRLVRAAYNYQYVAKDTGAFTHNPHYAVQLLYDSLESLGQAVSLDMTGLVRP
jgi:hypothetical protein